MISLRTLHKGGYSKRFLGQAGRQQVNAWPGWNSEKTVGRALVGIYLRVFEGDDYTQGGLIGN